MKKFILVFATLMMTITYANECKTIDLNKSANVVMGIEEPENDSFLEFFFDAIILMGCILDANSMDDLNMSRDTLILYREYVTESYEQTMQENMTNIMTLENMLKTKLSDADKKETEEKLAQAKKESSQAEADFALIEGQFEKLLMM